MQNCVTILGKPVMVNVTSRAATQLERRQQPLVMEMELYFSCLIRKAVHFGVTANPALSASVGEHLMLSFRPVMTKSCRMDAEKPAELIDFSLANLPNAKVMAYIPRWVKLDFKNGDWSGEFGYA